jgi:hypothetical protein
MSTKLDKLYQILIYTVVLSIKEKSNETSLLLLVENDVILSYFLICNLYVLQSGVQEYKFTEVLS